MSAMCSLKSTSFLTGLLYSLPVRAVQWIENPARSLLPEL